MSFLTESAITLTFPDTNGFRLANCQGYLPLNGNHFKEMDAGWIDISNQKVLFFELKDFSASAALAGNIEQRTRDLIKKSVDTLQMILCVQKNGALANNFLHCFPANVMGYEIEFYCIINAPGKEADIQLIHDKFVSIFKPYAQIWGVKKYVVMEKQQAIRLLDNIVS